MKETCLKLTNREIEVLHYVIMGYTNSKIAEKMHLSVSTIKTYLENIFRKLEVQNRMQAAIYAVSNNIININNTNNE